MVHLSTQKIIIFQFVAKQIIYSLILFSTNFFDDNFEFRLSQKNFQTKTILFGTYR